MKVRLQWFTFGFAGALVWLLVGGNMLATMRVSNAPVYRNGKIVGYTENTQMFWMWWRVFTHTMGCQLKMEGDPPGARYCPQGIKEGVVWEWSWLPSALQPAAETPSAPPRPLLSPVPLL